MEKIINDKNIILFYEHLPNHNLTYDHNWNLITIIIKYPW